MTLGQYRHRVDIVNSAGATVATRNDILRWRSRQPVNALGEFEVDFMTNDFGINPTNGDLVALYRFDMENASSPDRGWYVPFTGIHRMPVDKRRPQKTLIPAPDRPADAPYIRDFASNGFGLNDILDLAYIKWRSGSPEAKKSADIVTCLFEYANENVGPAALAASGRYVSNVVTPLGFAALPPLVGIIYDNDNAEKSLLKTLQAIAAYSLDNGQPIIFEITHNPNTYTFTYTIRTPTDRRRIGVSPVTGLNTAGNKPVTLSLNLGNISEITEIIDYAQESNQITALGKGFNGDRRARSRTAAGIVNDVNRRELIVNGDEQDTDAELDTLADSFISELRARPQYAIQLSRANVSIFRDFFPYDLVTLEFNSTEFVDCWITDISIDLARSGNEPIESILIEVTILD